MYFNPQNTCTRSLEPTHRSHLHSPTSKVVQLVPAAVERKEKTSCKCPNTQHRSVGRWYIAHRSKSKSRLRTELTTTLLQHVKAVTYPRWWWCVYRRNVHACSATSVREKKQAPLMCSPSHSTAATWMSEKAWACMR